jgi:hypothetical protein
MYICDSDRQNNFLLVLEHCRLLRWMNVRAKSVHCHCAELQAPALHRAMPRSEAPRSQLAYNYHTPITQ